MTDLEINKALALAIGHPEWAVRLYGHSNVIVCTTGLGEWPEVWKLFDYRDPTVIWPIAERYNAFPFMEDFGTLKGKWLAQPGFNDRFERVADTAAKAVALAVIAGAKK